MFAFQLFNGSLAIIYAKPRKILYNLLDIN